MRPDAKTNREIGKYFKENREKAGLTQSDVSTALGFYTSQAVSNAERGIAPFSPRHFKKLAKVLGVDKEELIKLYLIGYKAKLRSRS